MNSIVCTAVIALTLLFPGVILAGGSGTSSIVKPTPQVKIPTWENRVNFESAPKEIKPYDRLDPNDLYSTIKETPSEISRPELYLELEFSPVIFLNRAATPPGQAPETRYVKYFSPVSPVFLGRSDITMAPTLVAARTISCFDFRGDELPDSERRGRFLLNHHFRADDNETYSRREFPADYLQNLIAFGDRNETFRFPEYPLNYIQFTAQAGDYLARPRTNRDPSDQIIYPLVPGTTFRVYCESGTPPIGQQNTTASLPVPPEGRTNAVSLRGLINESIQPLP